MTLWWKQIFVGKHRGGRRVAIHVTDGLFQIRGGSKPVQTFLKADKEKEVRVKKPFPMPQKMGNGSKVWVWKFVKRSPNYSSIVRVGQRRVAR